jgi:hypothetical protein
MVFLERNSFGVTLRSLLGYSACIGIGYLFGGASELSLGEAEWNTKGKHQSSVAWCPSPNKESVNDAVNGLTKLWRAWDLLNTTRVKAEIPGLHWDRRLSQPDNDLNGTRVVVMSADNRALIPVESMPLNNRNLHYGTFSAIYNSWWAVRHGYDYRRVQIPAPDGFYKTWTKVKAIYDMLHRYDIVVFCDGDVFFAQPHLGLKDLMMRWGFHDRASILLSKDKERDYPFAEEDVNTGFLIIRSTALSKRIFRGLTYCALGKHPPDPELLYYNFAGCSKYKQQHFHEQSVLNDFFLRVMLREGEEFITTPCNETNGYWDDDQCHGTIITHAWSGKELIYKPMRDLFFDHHLQLYESLLWSGYHVTNCSKWSPSDERCDISEPELNTS